MYRGPTWYIVYHDPVHLEPVHFQGSYKGFIIYTPIYVTDQLCAVIQLNQELNKIHTHLLQLHNSVKILSWGWLVGFNL